MKKLILLLLTVMSLSSNAQEKPEMQVYMVSVLVDDPVKAFKFYTDTLGFEEVMYMPEAYIAVVKSPLAPNGVNILLEPTGPGGYEWAINFKKEAYALKMPVITFSCADIQETYNRLVAKGVKFKSEPVQKPYGMEAVFDDNNGNFIQLLEPPKEQ